MAGPTAGNLVGVAPGDDTALGDEGDTGSGQGVDGGRRGYLFHGGEGPLGLERLASDLLEGHVDKSLGHGLFVDLGLDPTGWDVAVLVGGAELLTAPEFQGEFSHNRDGGRHADRGLGGGGDVDFALVLLGAGAGGVHSGYNGNAEGRGNLLADLSAGEAVASRPESRAGD